jgi:tetratricopeptide (TPR) repeat protein/transcriptional regulator with XRE-family HTH domain
MPALGFPTGGRVLGVLVELLRLREEEDGAFRQLPQRQVSTYLEGDPVDPKKRVSFDRRQQIHQAVAQVLVSSGLIPSWTYGTELVGKPVNSVGECLGHIAAFMDLVHGELRARGPLDAPLVLMVRPLLRLASVEAGVRLGALFFLEGWPKPSSADLTWLSVEGPGAALRKSLVGEGKEEVSVATLAGEISDVLDDDDDLNRSTVTRWIRGETRPSIQHLRALAGVVAERWGRPQEDVLRVLRWQWALWDMGRRLAPLAGQDFVEEVAFAVCRYVGAVQQHLMGWSVPPEQARSLATYWLTLGTEDRRDELEGATRDMLLSVEQDPRWRMAIQFAYKDWFEVLRPLQVMARYLGGPVKMIPPKHAAEWEEFLRSGRHLVDDLFLPPPSSNLDVQGINDFERAMFFREHAVLHRNLGRALALSHRAIAINNQEPRGHFSLGATLIKFGRIEEAIPPLRIAHLLDPLWGPAAVDLASCLIQVGQEAEALALLLRLRDAQSRTPAGPTAPVLEHIGVAYHRLGKFPEACEALDASLRLRPDHFGVLALACECQIRAGNKRKGLTYARRAERLGFREAIEIYRRFTGKAFPPSLGA